MSAEFHSRTAALFEEFKKRELHFLNTEMKLNSKVNWKNSSLQDYLEKINKREQETEKSYKDLMRQMEDLSSRTDQMTLKLEKLNALRNVALSSSISAWPSTDITYDRPIQSYYSNSPLQTPPKMLSTYNPVSNLPPRIHTDISFINHSFQHSTSNSNYHSVHTQTEYIFCDNCHFPLILNSETAASNLNIPARTSSRIVGVENEQNQSHTSTRMQQNKEFSRAVITKPVVDNNNVVLKSNSGFSDPVINGHDDSLLATEGTSSGVAEISLTKEEFMNEQVGKRMPESYFDNTVKANFTKEIIQKRMTENHADSAVVDGPGNVHLQKQKTENYTDKAVADGPANAHLQKRISQGYTDNVNTDEPTKIPVQNRVLESYIDNVIAGDYITHTEEKQYVEIQDNDLLSNDGNVEQTISKSDDESMSHEFNFLDSDKITKRQSFHQTSVDTTSQLNEDVKLPKTTELDADYTMQSNPTSHLLQVQSTSGSGEKITVDNKDLSSSFGPPSPSAHSENTSTVSESDSFSEKETPLTATAAYQALLGNVSVPKPTQRNAPVSDSDTEDEIENALANAVRRTSRIAFDAATLNTKAEKRKESIVEIKDEKNTKSADPVSTNRPQSKLSKNTRKVLGLDTSSGSEVELEVKNPARKIEEESDEFDFYD